MMMPVRGEALGFQAPDSLKLSPSASHISKTVSQAVCPGDAADAVDGRRPREGAWRCQAVSFYVVYLEISDAGWVTLRHLVVSNVASQAPLKVSLTHTLSHSLSHHSLAARLSGGGRGGRGGARARLGMRPVQDEG